MGSWSFTSQVSDVANPTRDEATQRLLEIPPRTWKNTPSHQGTRTRHPAQVPKYIHHDMGFAARHW